METSATAWSMDVLNNFTNMTVDSNIFLTEFSISNAAKIIPRGDDASCKLNDDVYLNMFKSSNMYLTPFLLEFALTAAAMLVEVWLEINHSRETEATQQVTAVTTTQYGTATLAAEVTNTQISVSQKIKNAAGGVVVAIVIFGSFIFMLILMHFLTVHSNISIVFHVYKLIICLIMIGISVIGIMVLNNNRIKSSDIGLDDVLIYISIIGMICMSTFQIINAIASFNIYDASSNHINLLARLVISSEVLWIVETVVQSAFITKGLHRIPRRTAGCLKVFNPCCLAIVLAACNLGMWLLTTISLESIGEEDHNILSHSLVEQLLKLENGFYGEFVWMWIKLVLLPLMVFFRIHSFFTLLRGFDIHSHIAIKL
ncbi:proton channel OtopLc-like [Corticium candelabrum]|uniref:proton channel OtopLc-like n=1 Tax=Corticium candelabrum TaxID=121492 RepID=UPI002E26512E|nr:proton channel OtopLc-like [Corticium candelabrum]